MKAINKILILAASVLTLSSCGSNVTVPQHGDIPFLPYEGLKGNVQEVTETMYAARMKRGELVVDETPLTIVRRRFNKIGQLEETHTQSFFGSSTEPSMESKTTNTYKNGHLVEQVINSKSELGSDKITYSVVLDTKERVVYEDVHNKDSEAYSEVYEGLNETIYAGDKKMLEKLHNDKGYITEIRLFINNAPCDTTRFELNEDGDPIVEYRISGGQEGAPQIKKYEYSDYDTKGNWCSRMEIDAVNLFFYCTKREFKYR